MKKLLVLSLLISVLFVPFISSCAKKDKLVSNFMTVQIEPATVGYVLVGSTKELSVIVRNAIGQQVSPDSVSWTVSPNTLGTFSNPNSVKTSFTAVSSGSGTISVICEGIEATASITVS